MGSFFSKSCKASDSVEQPSKQSNSPSDGGSRKTEDTNKTGKQPAENPKLENIDPEFLALRETWQEEQDKLKKR